MELLEKKHKRNYMKILNSASKIVFIVMTLAIVALTFNKTVDAKDFVILASMAFSYYFASKPSNPEIK